MNRFLLCLVFLPCLAFGQNAGNALLFDGSDDLATIPHGSGLAFAANAPATFELWVFPNVATSYWHALGMRAGCGSTINYQIARDVSHLLHFNTTGCIFPSGIDLPINEWSHIAVTADGSKIRFYVNALEIGETNCGLGTTGETALTIGASGNCPYNFPGMIDEVRIWNTSKSAEELIAQYNCTIENPPADLVGYWQFDEETASQAVLDSSLSGFDGSLGADLDPGSDDPVRVASTAPLECVVFRDGFEYPAD